jgi:hypothetical protein
MVLTIDGKVMGRIEGFTITESRDLPKVHELGRESFTMPAQSTYSLELVSLRVVPELLAAIEAWKEKQK